MRLESESTDDGAITSGIRPNTCARASAGVKEDMAMHDQYDLADDLNMDPIDADNKQHRLESVEQECGLPRRKGLPEDDDDWYEPDYGSGRPT
ncbi:MAG TPA: hypothetical protein V6D22_12195 [Candidatus Obscuribacterales bacterium]